jgi:two-component system OmpR family sensor kinase
VSLRQRLLLGMLVVAAVLIGTNVVLASTFRSFLVRRVDEQLAHAVQRPPAPVDVGVRPGRLGRPRGGGPTDVFSEVYFAALDADGNVWRIGRGLREDQGAPDVTLDRVEGHVADHDDPAGFTVPAADGGGEWRVMAVVSSFGTTVVAASSLEDMAATLGRMRWIQVGGSLAVLGALGVVSWWVLRSGIRPMAGMAATADAIAAGDLSRRVDHADPRTEAGRLGAALNAMLGQIEEAFVQRAASEERVRQFAADASHELRTPLTSIRGYADLWRAGGFRAPGELDDAMRRMSEEANRMGVLVDELLLLARLDQARPLDLQPLRLDELVADAVRDAEVVDPDRSITLTVAPVVVAGDDARLRQVVANLLANARTHTPPGTAVHVTVGQEDHQVRLEVADDGPGLDPEVAARVFDRFYRADSARTRASGGSGLGLSIVAAVAEAHGGRARVSATPGAGSRFVVELPALDGDGDAISGRGDAA